MMTRYLAQIMHGNRDAERDYYFEAAEDLLSHSPATVLRSFMQHLDETAGLGHIDYELNAAMKDRNGATITALGSFVFKNNNTQPFVCMISAA